MEKKVKEEIREKIQKLIKEKTIKSEEDFQDFGLDKIERLAYELEICPRDLIIYLTCGGDCDNCDKEYKSDECKNN